MPGGLVGHFQQGRPVLAGLGVGGEGGAWASSSSSGGGGRRGGVLGAARPVCSRTPARSCPSSFPYPGLWQFQDKEKEVNQPMATVQEAVGLDVAVRSPPGPGECLGSQMDSLKL